jgi:hypothetical protein
VYLKLPENEYVYPSSMGRNLNIFSPMPSGRLALRLESTKKNKKINKKSIIYQLLTVKLAGFKLLKIRI